MLDIRVVDGEIRLGGVFDASQVPTAEPVFEEIQETSVVNFQGLEYISSAGLSVLLMTQKRLAGAGHELKLVNLSNHISDVFRYAGFDLIFSIE